MRSTALSTIAGLAMAALVAPAQAGKNPLNANASIIDLHNSCQMLSIGRVPVRSGITFSQRQADVNCCVQQGGRLCASTRPGG
jgi:hypothetical protein